MPPFSGSATARLLPAVGTWTVHEPMIATFSVGNLGKRVAGTIPVTSTEVDVAEDGTVRGASAELDIAAIDTGHTRRDRDLRKPNLLDLANHPRMTFSSTRLAEHDSGWTVAGLLTVKGTTREISLDATAELQADGTVRLRLTGQLDRTDYGIKAPRFMIGKTVDIDIDITLRRQ